MNAVYLTWRRGARGVQYTCLAPRREGAKHTELREGLRLFIEDAYECDRCATAWRLVTDGSLSRRHGRQAVPGFVRATGTASLSACTCEWLRHFTSTGKQWHTNERVSCEGAKHNGEILSAEGTEERRKVSSIAQRCSWSERITSASLPNFCVLL